MLIIVVLFDTFVPHVHLDSDKPEELGFDIQSRTVVVNGNIKTVTDKIMLYHSEEKGGNGSTPLEYKLTNIGTYTAYEIYSVALDDISDESISSFKSHIVKGELDYDYEMFESGDGSANSKYVINNETQLNNVRYFTDRHFVITSNINYTGNWGGIDDEFTGSIYGQKSSTENYKITFPGMSAKEIVNSRNQYIAFVSKNSGTISNIDFNVTISNNASLGESIMLQVGVVARENSGTISNINVNPTITLTPSLQSLVVGGITAFNFGTIDGCNVGGNISAIPSKGFGSVGGISYYVGELGVIKNANYSGNITANNIGGIVYMATNFSEINNCNVSDSTLTGRAYTGSSTALAAYSSVVGGLIGDVSMTMSTYDSEIYKGITNSRVVATLVVDFEFTQSGSQNVHLINGTSYFAGLIAKVYFKSEGKVTVNNSSTDVVFKTATNDGSYSGSGFEGYPFTPSGDKYKDTIVCTSCATKWTTNNSLSVQIGLPSGVSDNR